MFAAVTTTINRATDRNMPRRAGHVEGARRAGEAVEACRELGVEVKTKAFKPEEWGHGTLLCAVICSSTQTIHQSRIFLELVCQ